MPLREFDEWCVLDECVAEERAEDERMRELGADVAARVARPFGEARA